MWVVIPAALPLLNIQFRAVPEFDHLDRVQNCICMEAAVHIDPIVVNDLAKSIKHPAGSRVHDQIAVAAALLYLNQSGFRSLVAGYYDMTRSIN